MEQNQTIVLLASFLGGFVMQWLRALPGFSERWTYVVALFGGVLGFFLTVSPSDVPGLAEGFLGWTPRASFIALAVMQHTLTILGGVMVGHSASHMTPVVPKFNSKG